MRIDFNKLSISLCLMSITLCLLSIVLCFVGIFEDTPNDAPPTASAIPAEVVEEVIEVVECTTATPDKPWTDEEAEVLAKMLWGEARGIPSDTQKAAVIWCVLNRVDKGYGTVIEVTTAPGQFIGYRPGNPVDDRLLALCEDVLSRWHKENAGAIGVGRVLPEDYLWFSGDGEVNHFRDAYRGGARWDWSLPSPYES